MPPHEVDELGYAVDPKLRELELLVGSLAGRYRGHRGDSEAQQLIVQEYRSVIEELYSLGWDGELDFDCLLPKEDMPEEYMSRNPDSHAPFPPNAFVMKPNTILPGKTAEE